jgi:hypothetical protein
MGMCGIGFVHVDIGSVGCVSLESDPWRFTYRAPLDEQRSCSVRLLLWRVTIDFEKVGPFA